MCDGQYVKVNGYELASAYCRQKQRGGTCIMAKKDITYKEITFLKKYTTPKAFEACGIEIPLHKLIVICLYRIPKSDPTVFLNKLDQVLHEISKRYKTKQKIVVTGDFNINTLKPGRHHEHLKDISKNYNLIIHINTPTRKDSCIDHILSNIKNATASVLPLYLSDHDTAQILSFPVDQSKFVPKSHFVFKKSYSYENITKFKECLSNLSWLDVYNENDLNTAFENFHNILCLFYELCFPTIKVKVSNTNLKKQSWITKGLKICCKTKRFLRQCYYKRKTSIDKRKYLTYSKILKKSIRLAQMKSNINFVNRSKNKCRATWSVIKDQVSATKIDDDITTLTINNKTLINPSDIATVFNDYFIDLTNNLTYNFTQYDHNITPIANSIFLMPVTDEEVKKEIMSLNNTNSAGYDGIITKIIKMSVSEITCVLTYLINLSFSSGTFPDKLKISIVKPLYKKGDREDPQNYRPITLIPVLSKVFEKCILKRLNNFCSKHGIIKKEQFGFQKDKSTTLAIYNLVATVLTNLNQKCLTTGVFFDLSKAFDYVDHNILLYKLETVGIRGLALKWIASYLSSRQQCVRFNKIVGNEIRSISSEFRIKSYGVPQGSVLGPLLFLLYINDITKITNHKCTLFADDISIIISSNNKTNLRNHEMDIENTIDKIIKWLQLNNLKINLDKSKYIQFNKSKHKKYNFTLNITKINETNCLKFLGVTIDEDLNWKAHLDSVCSRINKFVYALREIKKVTNLKTAIISYHAYVESVLRYGIILWGNSTLKNRAFIAQKKCIRAICGIAPDESCRPLFKKLGLLPLASLYIQEVSVFVHKNPELFQRSGNLRLRCPQRLVIQDIPRSSKYGKSSLCMCVRIYNKLPNELKMLAINSFKNRLYRWLNEQSFYELKDFFSLKLQ